MQTSPKTYCNCNGCPNLITGTVMGTEYRSCKADVRIPDLCPRLTAKIYAKVKDKEAKREISDTMNDIIPLKEYNNI